MQYLLRESKAAKSITKQLEKQRSTMMKELSKQESDLRAARAEIERQRSILSPDAFSAKAKEWEQKWVQLDHTAQSKRKSLDYTRAAASNKVIEAIAKVSSEIALERNATLVLPKEAVVLVDKSLEITDEVLKRLDQKLPTVAVNLVQPGEAGAGSKAKGMAEKKR
jgi:Skp family chaperone for outer membrane proteins